LDDSLLLLIECEESIRKFLEKQALNPTIPPSSISPTADPPILTPPRPKSLPPPSPLTKPLKSVDKYPPVPAYIPTPPVPFYVTKYTEEIKKAEALKIEQEAILNGLIKEKEEKLKIITTEKERLEQELHKFNNKIKIAEDAQEKDIIISKNKELPKQDRKNANQRIKDRTILYSEISECIPGLEYRLDKNTKEGEKIIEKCDSEIEKLKKTNGKRTARI